MARTTQIHSPGIARNSTITMNNRQDSTKGRRAAANSSPQWAGRPNLLQKAVRSPVATESSPMLKSVPSSMAAKGRGIVKGIETPVSESLNPNVTPRSSARRARVDSSLSTPVGTPMGTPSNSRPTSMVYDHGGDENTNNTPNFGIGGTSVRRTVRSSSISSDRSNLIRPSQIGRAHV